MSSPISSISPVPGRDPATMGIRGTIAPLRSSDKRVDLERTLAEALPRMQASGVTHASLALAAFARRAEEVRPFLEALGKLREGF